MSGQTAELLEMIEVDFERERFTVQYKGPLNIKLNTNSVGFFGKNYPDTSLNNLMDRLEDTATHVLYEEFGNIGDEALLYPCKSIEGSFPDWLRSFSEFETETSGFLSYERQHFLKVKDIRKGFVPRNPTAIYEASWMF